MTPRTSDASRSVTSPENMPARTLQRVSGPFQHQYASRGDLPPFLRKRYCRSHRGCSSRSRPRYPRLGQPVAPAWFAGEAAHSTKANPLLHALFVESGQDPPFPILRNFHHAQFSSLTRAYVRDISCPNTVVVATLETRVASKARKGPSAGPLLPHRGGISECVGALYLFLLWWCA